jgi:hypothetical protein
MDKVVHLFEIFKFIFYYKFIDLGKVKIGSIKIWRNLNVFKPFENFQTVQTAPPNTVAPGPRVSDPSPLLGVAPPARNHRPRAGAGRRAPRQPPPLRSSPSSTRTPAPDPPPPPAPSTTPLKACHEHPPPPFAPSYLMSMVITGASPEPPETVAAIAQSAPPR